MKTCGNTHESGRVCLEPTGHTGRHVDAEGVHWTDDRWQPVEPSGTPDGAVIRLAGQTIRGTQYGVGPCYVAGVECIAVKAGKAKRIVGNRTDARAWLMSHGMQHREAQTFIKEGIDRVKLAAAIDERMKQGR